MRRAVLLLPAAALLLALDRAPAPPAPPLHAAADFDAVLRALPPRDEGRLGREGDALNLIFLGSPADVEKAVSAAGWTRISPSWSRSVLAGLRELWLGKTLAGFPPMNEYRVLGRAQDFNWSLPVSGIESRHHFRLWRTGIADARGREIWWGSGNFDRAIRWLDLSHRPDPDMDVERDFIAASLLKVSGVQTSLVALPQIPRAGRNDKGYAFRTDGRALVVAVEK